MNINVLVTVLILFSIIGIILIYRLISKYFRMQDELKRISKPSSDIVNPILPVFLDKTDKENQTNNSNTGEKSNKKPNNTRLSKGINSFSDSVDDETKDKNTEHG